MHRYKVLEFKTVKMGGPFSILLLCNEKQVLRAARDAEVAFAEVSRIEDMLTDFRTSPLTQLNSKAGLGPVKVPEEIYQLVRYANAISAKSKGAFDITYAPVGHLWRNAFKSKQIPAYDELMAAKRLVNYREIELFDENRMIKIGRLGMKIGLGGVGKGYAVDAVSGLLAALGYESFLVNGAGDIRAQTHKDTKRAWTVGLKNPFAVENKMAGSMQLYNGAVATSGDYERFLEIGGKRFHHVLDARTGDSRNDIRSVTIFAKTALQADIFATTCMALGVEESKLFILDHKDVRAIVIDESGQVLRWGFAEASDARA